MSTPTFPDYRFSQYLEAVSQMQHGDYEIELPMAANDEAGRLGEAIGKLALTLETRQREQLRLQQITQNINAGLLLEEILMRVYQDFWEIIPYNRIGVALVEAGGAMLRSVWCKSDQSAVLLPVNYTAPLAGSSLEAILQSGTPRIINDLLAYLEHKPQSGSTRMIVSEGMRSSLTCPLIANGTPTGFIFFSSVVPGAYLDAHVDIYRQIASQISVIFEKGRLASELASKKQEIEQQNIELLRLSAIKNTFLGIAAHDLRSPASFIQMTVNLLRGSDADLYRVHQDELLDQISRQTQRMLGLLNDLLDLAEIESGRMRLKRELLELEPFFVDVIQTHTLLAAPKMIRLTLSPVPTGKMYADAERMRQVMDNLISNAVKYSPRESVVWMEAQPWEDGWRIQVRDEGPGIEAEERMHLFEAFSRLSTTPTGGEKTSGLGLAIVRWIVEAHGGQIGVTSTPGSGSVFWFTLPGRSSVDQGDR